MPPDKLLKNVNRGGAFKASGGIGFRALYGDLRTIIISTHAGPTSLH